MAEYKGLFIAFEGGDGSGKTTQARRLSEALTAIDIPNLLTKEPGDTELGADLRRILLDRDRKPMSKKAEALLFAADRAEHVETVVVPAIERGEVVICDRYMASNIAYQVYGDHLSYDTVNFLSNFASGGLTPDVTFFLDIDPLVGLCRARRTETTKFEDKPLGYHHRVRRGFVNQMNRTWAVLDASLPSKLIHVMVLDHTLAMCEKKSIYAKPREISG